jgi:glycosyltransferase involved in cell wall biosynthesis
MPYVPEDGSVDRTALGVDEGTFLAGFFGTLRARHLSHVDAAMHAMTTAAKEMSRPEPVLLYVGPNGPEFKDALPDHSVIDAGRLPAEDVSRHFRVMDLQFAPFIDGVSTRRGSLMAGLQHGVPTLGTTGPLTDGVLSEADGTAIKLCPVHDTDAFAAAAVELFTRSDERRALGASGQALYDQKFAFDATVQGMLELLRAFDSKPGRPLVAA